RDLDPSGATLEMVRNLGEPVTVTLAFPPANDVAEAVTPYFESLDEASDLLSVERMDSDRDPSRAKELRIRKNGTVVISVGDDHKSLALGVDPGKARSKLKKLDADFQKNLSKVAGGEKVAYFVHDHGERSTTPSPKDPQGLKTAKKLLEQIGYKVKNLGLKQGLADAVPDDARIVFLIGPTHALFPAEVDSLLTWLQAGGALMVLVEPEPEDDLQLDSLFTALGVKVEPGVLAHERYHMRFNGGPGDRSFLFTNSYGTHPSTELLSKNRSQLQVLSYGAGALVKLPAGPGGPEVTETLKSLSNTWADLDGDFEFDRDAEKRQVASFAAAVQLPVTEEGGELGGRAIVGMDADLIADLPMSRPGNLQWFFDGIRWLEDEIELSGEVADIEDVKILHSQDEDSFSFWGTTAGLPLLVLGLGLFNGVRRRRRKQ
ncbi:MAG: DUF4350 domain-containing protein, partial [Myxococcota bacterium]|nr:DUF4350 domain-containing protein [Myxococcota bacterium]